MARRSPKRPKPKNELIRARLENTGRRDTGPERRLRSALHARGLRFFVDRSPIAGMRARADLVFPGKRVAVFVDGCFWHGCPIHGTTPKNNAAWWRAKLYANQERDLRVAAHLRDAGWSVVRVWEHCSLEDAVDAVTEALDRMRTEPAVGSFDEVAE